VRIISSVDVAFADRTSAVVITSGCRSRDGATSDGGLADVDAHAETNAHIHGVAAMTKHASRRLE
jgi:hypothetical protein